MKKPLIGATIVFLLLLLPAFAMAQADTSSVWSQKPLYLTDATTGIHYGPGDWKGITTINWKYKTRYGFYETYAETATGDRFEFILVSISNSSDDYIEGLWDIYKNGTNVCLGCVGKAYGLDLPVGDYFKLYVGDSQCFSTTEWHVSGYITNRLDY